jgi:hypothetical protein
VNGRRAACAAALFLAATVATPIAAQEVVADWIEADVVGIAGSDFYVSVGTNAGLRTNAVYEVRLPGLDGATGKVTVLQAGAERSALTFADAPFAITRGAHVGLRLLQAGPPTDEARVAPAVPSQGAAPATRYTTTGPEVHGSFGASYQARSTTTEWESVGLPAVDRTFTTPSAWLNLTVAQLPGGFRLRVNARATHRGSTDDLIQPAGLARVYAAQLSGRVGIVDLGIGRGFNPYDASSGYLDGIYLRAGRTLGIGASVGYEPERSNGAFSTEVPKTTVFADFAHRSPSVRYSTVASFTS